MSITQISRFSYFGSIINGKSVLRVGILGSKTAKYMTVESGQDVLAALKSNKPRSPRWTATLYAGMEKALIAEVEAATWKLTGNEPVENKRFEAYEINWDSSIFAFADGVIVQSKTAKTTSRVEKAADGKLSHSQRVHIVNEWMPQSDNAILAVKAIRKIMASDDNVALSIKAI